MNSVNEISALFTNSAIMHEHKLANEILNLTKRELFAAMAMQGLLANSVELENHKVNGGYIVFERIAIRAMLAADELIKELNK